MPGHLIPKTGIAQTTNVVAEHVAPCAARCPRLDSMEPLWKRTNTLKTLAVGALALVAVLIGAWLYGSYRWNAGTQGLRVRMDAARVPVPAADHRLPRTGRLAGPGRALLPRGARGGAADGGRGARAAHGYIQHGREHGPVEGFRLGSEGGHAATRLRLERARQDDDRPARAGARRLCGGRGRPARLRARALPGCPDAKRRRRGRRRIDALLRRGGLVSHRPAAQPGRALGSKRRSLGPGHVNRRRYFYNDALHVRRTGPRRHRARGGRGRTVGGKVVPTPWH